MTEVVYTLFIYVCLVPYQTQNLLSIQTCYLPHRDIILSISLAFVYKICMSTVISVIFLFSEKQKVLFALQPNTTMDISFLNGSAQTLTLYFVSSIFDNFFPGKHIYSRIQTIQSCRYLSLSLHFYFHVVKYQPFLRCLMQIIKSLLSY